MSECQCAICKGSCTRKPGWFIPGEVELVAEYLELTLQELFENLLGVDYWMDDNNIYLLAPALTNMQAGTEYPYNPWGTCIFFNDKELCDIHPVKPYECRVSMHDGQEGLDHEGVAQAWMDHREQIVELLGREPYQTELEPLGDLTTWFDLGTMFDLR